MQLMRTRSHRFSPFVSLKQSRSKSFTLSTFFPFRASPCSMNFVLGSSEYHCAVLSALRPTSTLTKAHAWAPIESEPILDSFFSFKSTTAESSPLFSTRHFEFFNSLLALKFGCSEVTDCTCSISMSISVIESTEWVIHNCRNIIIYMFTIFTELSPQRSPIPPLLWSKSFSFFLWLNL